MKMNLLKRVIGFLFLPHFLTAFQCESSSVRSKEADPMSCRKYYNCRDGLAETQQCGEQDIFDVIFKMCRAAEVVNTCSFAPRDCYIGRGNGFDYQGNLSVTTSGIKCQEWSKSIYSFDKYKLGNNYCRNPNPEQYEKPWCPTGIPEKPTEICDIPKCTGASATFNGRGSIVLNTGVGASNSTYDLEASYEEQILLYIRPTNTETTSVLFAMNSLSDDQTYYVRLFKKVISVFAWLEAGKTVAKANTWIDLADGQSHKIVIRRNQDKIFLKVDDGPEHYSRLAGKTDKFMLPMKVQIGKNFKGCISSFDIITKNSKGLYRHYEPMEVLTGNTLDEKMDVKTEGAFNKDFTSGCMLTPKFSETVVNILNPTTAPPTAGTHINGTEAEVKDKSGTDLYVILACVIGAALVILVIVLVIVCRSRNRDKGVYKLKETKQFDWEYGNLPPASKGAASRENEHGV